MKAHDERSYDRKLTRAGFRCYDDCTEEGIALVQAHGARLRALLDKPVVLAITWRVGDALTVLPAEDRAGTDAAYFPHTFDVGQLSKPAAPSGGGQRWSSEAQGRVRFNLVGQWHTHLRRGHRRRLPAFMQEGRALRSPRESNKTPKAQRTDARRHAFYECV